jgi:hypothetical protein
MDGRPALSEEKCPLEVVDWSPQGTIEDQNPTISATFRSACGANIEVSSIQMLLEGSPVSHALNGSGSEVTATYTPESELTMDVRYKVTVSARDVNGSAVEKKWLFYLPFHY